MNQKKADINKDELSKEYLHANGYKYCLLYYLNDIFFGDVDNLIEINREILVEAFFFNDQRELHFFEDNGYQGIITEKTYEDDENSFEETFELKIRLGNKSVKNKYRKLEVINYLDYEKDGQAYIKYTALKGVSE